MSQRPTSSDKARLDAIQNERLTNAVQGPVAMLILKIIPSQAWLLWSSKETNSKHALLRTFLT